MVCFHVENYISTTPTVASRIIQMKYPAVIQRIDTGCKVSDLIINWTVKLGRTALEQREDLIKMWLDTLNYSPSSRKAVKSFLDNPSIQTWDLRRAPDRSLTLFWFQIDKTRLSGELLDINNLLVETETAERDKDEKWLGYTRLWEVMNLPEEGRKNSI